MYANKAWQAAHRTSGIWPVINLKSIFEYSRSCGICKKKTVEETEL
jgi:hypothetical protein